MGGRQHRHEVPLDLARPEIVLHHPHRQAVLGGVRLGHRRQLGLGRVRAVACDSIAKTAMQTARTYFTCSAAPPAGSGPSSSWSVMG